MGNQTRNDTVETQHDCYMPEKIRLLFLLPSIVACMLEMFLT